jgi:hypothetical protein
MSRSSPRGRRIATTSRRRPSPTVTRSGIAAAVLAVLAAVAVVTVRPAAGGDVTGATASGEPVTHLLRVCPDTGARGQGRARVSVGALPSPDLGDGGTVAVGPLGEQAATVPLSRGAVEDQPAARGASTTVKADGEIAAGLFGFRTAGSGASTTATACPQPRASWWFTGAGATLDHTSTLVLANADPGPAVVDVRLFGPDGEIDALGTRGITIGPGSQRVVDLTDVAPQSDEVAVHVEASRGRVVAAVADSFATQPGAVPGQGWLPAAERPSRVLRLGGTVGRADERTLVVANPSDLEALVELEVAGPSGRFVPSDLKSVRVAPGTVEVADISDVVGSDPEALQLRSRVPVVASLRSTRGGDVAYSGAVQPLRAPAAAPVADTGRTTVLLSGGRLPGRAQVTAYDEKGRRVGREQVQVPVGATVESTPKHGAAYVVVEVREGAVTGAVTYPGGALTAVPLVGLPLRLRVPAVEPALSER